MPTEHRTYAVGAEPVTLRIVVGEGQMGGVAVGVGDDDITAQNGLYTLGAGDHLVGQPAFAAVSVSLANPASRRTSVTYTLDGGVNDTFTLEQDLTGGTGGAVVDYRLFMTFTSAAGGTS
jgi:hypothetical protein